MIIVNNKTITQPYVYTDGEWKKVSAEYASSGSEWKKVFSSEQPAKSYTINIYNYGILDQTLEIASGESTTLPDLGIGYALSDDDLAIHYTAGETVTPTENLDLYTVHSYTVKLYKYGTLHSTITSNSQKSTASFTLPSCPIDSDDDEFYGWTETEGSTERSYTADETLETNGLTLYAVFSYTVSGQKTISRTYDLKTNVNNFPVTISSSCNITVEIYNYTVFGGPSGTSTGKDSLTLMSSSDTASGIKNAYFSVSGTYLTGTYSYTKGFSIEASKGTVIRTGGYKTTISDSSGSTTYYPHIKISYPETYSSTEYRSSK